MSQLYSVFLRRQQMTIVKTKRDKAYSKLTAVMNRKAMKMSSCIWGGESPRYQRAKFLDIPYPKTSVRDSKPKNVKNFKSKS